jgi:hypothetical protein
MHIRLGVVLHGMYAVYAPNTSILGKRMCIYWSELKVNTHRLIKIVDWIPTYLTIRVVEFDIEQTK